MLILNRLLLGSTLYKSVKNIRHHVIVVTSNQKEKLEKIRKEVIELYQSKMEAKNSSKLVGPIQESLINGFVTFLIAPDGSKEGYDASDDADRIRQLVVDLVRSFPSNEEEGYLQFVEVSYGQDDGKAQIVSNN